MKKNTKERFEEKFVVSESGCWIWQSNFYTSGYGYFRLNNKNKSAHRVSYTLYKGDIPYGLHVLHECDNTKCVNPSHLFLGTHTDNMRDAMKKCRKPTMVCPSISSYIKGCRCSGCKEAGSKRTKDYYQKNKAIYKEKNKINYQKRKELI